MKPGRELDALVAEKVMGGLMIVPEYSTDIEAAWQVVENLRSQGFSVAIEGGPSDFGAVFERDGAYIGDSLAGPRACAGDTGPHAICIAALDAVGVVIASD